MTTRKTDAELKAIKIKVPVVPKCMQGVVIKHGSKKFIAIEDCPSLEEERIEELESRNLALLEGLKVAKEALERTIKVLTNEYNHQIVKVNFPEALEALKTISALLSTEAQQ